MFTTHVFRLTTASATGRLWSARAVLISCIVVNLPGCANDASIQGFAQRSNTAILQQPQAMAKNAEVQTYINELTGEVLQVARARRFSRAEDAWVYDGLKARVVLDPQANAFVTGDEIVFVHSGLIRDIEHPDQLLACLTHELAHNELRHLENNINSASFNVACGVLAITGSIMGGDLGRGLAGGSGAAIGFNQLATTGFNRAEELAADAHGLELYCAMGYDPAQFKRVFEILREKYGEGGGSHPRNSERIRQIEQSPVVSSATASKSLDVARFREIQSLVAAEEAAFKGKSILQDRSLRNGLMSCFDYCHCRKPASPETR